jgi:hypothetical protein
MHFFRESFRAVRLPLLTIRLLPQFVEASERRLTTFAEIFNPRTDAVS